MLICVDNISVMYDCATTAFTDREISPPPKWEAALLIHITKGKWRGKTVKGFLLP